jgi:hypothetical protein
MNGYLVVRAVLRVRASWDQCFEVLVMNGQKEMNSGDFGFRQDTKGTES